jgi:hypothetical protein
LGPDVTLPPGPEEVTGPFELSCRVTVSSLFKEARADLVTNGGFADWGFGQPKGFFVQTGGFLPPVLALEDAGKNEQGIQSVG